MAKTDKDTAKGLPITKGMDAHWEVMHIKGEYEKAVDANFVKRKALEKSQAMYSGFDYGQWEQEAISNLKADNRNIPQYNMVRGKIDTLVGSILKNKSL